MSEDHVQLSRRERQIMDILYELREATAAEVRERLPQAPSYSAVRALLAKLKQKGHISHRQDGPRYVFAPVVERAAARDSAMTRWVRTFFGGSTAQAAAGLLDRSVDTMTDEELDRLSKMIEDARQGRSSS